MKLQRETASAALMASLVVLSGCGGGGGSKRSQSTVAPSTSASVGGGSSASSGGTVNVTRLAQGRAEHTATSTPSGDVVVAGGESAGQVLKSVEVYKNGAWSAGAPLSTPRKGHSATLLQNGQVLIVGGQSDATGQQLVDSTELFDPVTGAVKAGPKLARGRTGHVAISFSNAGNELVLVAGGAGSGGSLGTAEVIDLKRNVVTPLAARMVADRVDARALLLPNGKILIQGGLTGLSATAFSLTPAGAELFDPATQTFSAAGTLGIDRFDAGLSILDNGLALVLGGNSQARVEGTGEVYDPVSNAWANFPASLGAPREGLTLTQLRQGELLAVGGSDAGPSAAVERLDGRPQAVAGTFSTLAPLLEARRDHTSTLLQNGNVLIVGGNGAAGTLSTAEEYDAYGAGVPSAPLPPVVGPIGPVGPTTPAGAPPQILAILPTKGKPGDLITIAGRNFGKKKADNQVLFAGNVFGKVLFEVAIKSLPLIGSVETLVVEVPQGAQTGDVNVLVAGQTSSGKNFTIDLQSGGTPQVLYTLPRRGNVGSIVTIFGRNFANPATGNTVKFSGVTANLIGGITTQSVPFLGNLSVMVTRVPAGAVTGDLTIEHSGKVSRGYAFEVRGTTAAPSGSTPPSTTPASNPPSTTPSTPSTPSTPGMTTFFTEDFEGQTVKFSHQGGLWEASRPTGVAAASGQWCAGTKLSTGSYTANARGYLISREIDLSTATTAELTFKSWFETDGVDAGRIVISKDNGQTFFLLRPSTGYRATSVFNPAEGITGNSNGWVTSTVDLSRYAGEKILVIFDFKSDGQDQRKGWLVDDVTVRGN